MASQQNHNDNNDPDPNDDMKTNTEDAQADAQTKQAAADLEKVTDFHEDKDEMNIVSTESLGNLKAQPEQKKFTLRKEDIQTIMQELEVPRLMAERKLVQHKGNLRAAILDMIGFE